MREIKHILVGIDYSEYSREAARYAVYLAKSFGAEVQFLQVVELPPFYGRGVGQLSGATLKSHLSKEEELKDSTLKEMKKFVNEFETEGLELKFSTACGNAPTEIIRYAHENDPDLIVLGTHGRKGISKYIIGSVAEKVVRRSPCPVLTVKLTNQTFDMSG